MLKRNLAKEINGRRNQYKFWNRKIKDLVKESKRRVHKEFGIKLSEKFKKNKKSWKEVKEEKGVQGVNVRIK